MSKQTDTGEPGATHAKKMPNNSRQRAKGERKTRGSRGRCSPVSSRRQGTFGGADKKRHHALRLDRSVEAPTPYAGADRSTSPWRESSVAPNLSCNPSPGPTLPPGATAPDATTRALGRGIKPLYSPAVRSGIFLRDSLGWDQICVPTGTGRLDGWRWRARA